MEGPTCPPILGPICLALCSGSPRAHRLLLGSQDPAGAITMFYWNLTLPQVSQQILVGLIKSADEQGSLGRVI